MENHPSIPNNLLNRYLDPLYGAPPNITLDLSALLPIKPNSLPVSGRVIAVSRGLIHHWTGVPL